MKKYVALIVLFSFISVLWAQGRGSEGENDQKDWSDGVAEGKIAGGQKNTSDWFAYGCGGGFLGGCLGGGIVYAMANSGEMPPYVPKGNSDFRQGYVQGYQETVKSKKTGSALTGGIVGTLVSVAAVIIIYAAVD